MAIQRRVNFISQQRIDDPTMRSIESAVSNDFDQLIQAFVTNTSQGYILRGFNILITGAIGGASNGLFLQVDPGAVFHINASQSGTVLMVPPGTPNQQLNAATNTNIVGSFVPNSVNYVTLDYIRFLDPSTTAQFYLWNPTSDTETTINAPSAQIMTYVINISTSTPTSNLLPIATVVTDGGNNVVSITDDRWLLFRLGTGGLNPNPYFQFPWPETQVENPITASGATPEDPFYGGDKGIYCLKDWMNAVMTLLQQIEGTNFWYSGVGASGSLAYLREDLGNTVVTSAGNISHGIIPNSTPILATTGNITVGSDQLTSLASTAGLINGLYIVGTGIPTGTTEVGAPSGSTVTMSENATLNATGLGISFYSPSVITAAGQINWDQPIVLDIIGSSLSYVLASNVSTTDITLADDQVAYILLTRDKAIVPNLIFVNGSHTVVSVGSTSWTTLLEAGDFVKLASDTHSGYYKIQSVDSTSQVTLVDVFAESSTGAIGAQAQYAFGNYYASPTPSGDPRAIQITSRETVPINSNVFWLFLREDNGGSQARVYVRFLGLELTQGTDLPVSDTVPTQLLQYIGSPIESASKPQYVSALNPGSVPQITLLSFGAESTIAQSSYFFINSSANARQYYVWFNENGGGADPNPGVQYTAVPVALTTGMTAAQVATAVTNALNSTVAQDFNAVQQSGPNTNEVLVTNTSAGTSTAASNFNVGSPFAITIDQSGTGTGNTFI